MSISWATEKQIENTPRSGCLLSTKMTSAGMRAGSERQKNIMAGLREDLSRTAQEG